jgi:hypothetical protein
LALRIAAASLAGRGDRALAGYVARLRGDQALSTLEISGDDSLAVRAAFDSSFAALSPAVARLFALLGLVPGHEIGAPAIAALSYHGSEAAARMLAELTRIHLVAEPAPGRFAFHDLLRLYARERAAAALGEDDACAIDRLPGTTTESSRR